MRKKLIRLRCASLKTIFLYGSAGVTLGAMILCLVSAGQQLTQLSANLGMYSYSFKAELIEDSYEPPALVFFGNGMYAYECLPSEFRLDPKPLEGELLGKKYKKIHEDCEVNTTNFLITLNELNQYKEEMKELPSWLQKNIVTTVADLSRCDSSVRRKRDIYDDLEVCFGDCQEIWECANDPSICDGTQIFQTCFDEFHIWNTGNQMCSNTHKCLAGPVELLSCTEIILCLKIDTINTPDCQVYLQCLMEANFTDKFCRKVFQCIEDQVQPKCESGATLPPLTLNTNELNETCTSLSELAETQPDILQQTNPSLTLIIIKGPSEFRKRNFLYSSFRTGRNERGIWAAVHHSYDEVMEWYNNKHSIEMLVYLTKNMRWNLLARGLKSFYFMSKSENLEDNVVVDTSIRLELTVAEMNDTTSAAKDYIPVEVVYQWKDGYIVKGNKFKATTVFEAFSVLAAILLMIERAWLTWGRVVKKIIQANAEQIMSNYEVGSPEWLIFKKILDSGTNLVTAMVAMKRLKEEEIHQRNLAEIRKKLEEKRLKRAEEKRQRMLEASEMTKWDEKRRIEWELYKNMLEEENKRNAKIEEELILREQERMKYMKSTDVKKKFRDKYRAKSRNSDDTEWLSTGSSDIIDFTNTEAKAVSHKQLQDEIRKKKSKKFNLGLDVDADGLDEARKKKKAEAARRLPWESRETPKPTSAFPRSTPQQWLNNAFNIEDEGM